MLLDAHAHLDKYTEEELDHALQQIEERRILTISVATELDSYRRATEIASRSRLIIPAFGVHPWNAPEYVDRLEELGVPVAESPMIGEIGLDYHSVDDAEQYPAQRLVFDNFLEDAVRQDKTVNLHTKGAETEVLAALRAHRPPRVIVHWYAGPDDVLRELSALGVFFSIGVEVGFSDGIRHIARLIPDELLLTETDGPGAMRWLRNVAGMPADLDEVICGLAEVKGALPADIAALVRGNMLRLVEQDPHLRRCEQIEHWRDGNP